MVEGQSNIGVQQEATAVKPRRSIIIADKVVKIYGRGATRVAALKSVNLNVKVLIELQNNEQEVKESMIHNSN